MFSTIFKIFSPYLAWMIHKEHQTFLNLEDGTIDLGSMSWDNALNQTDDLIDLLYTAD